MSRTRIQVRLLLMSWSSLLMASPCAKTLSFMSETHRVLGLPLSDLDCVSRSGSDRKWRAPVTEQDISQQASGTPV
ncbi:uncharacterized protein BJ212DRAFT_1394144, partial [Suillus subaureus]